MSSVLHRQFGAWPVEGTMYISHTDICADVSYGMYATRHGLNEEQLVHLWTNLGIFVASCLRCAKVCQEDDTTSHT